MGVELGSGVGRPGVTVGRVDGCEVGDEVGSRDGLSWINTITVQLPIDKLRRWKHNRHPSEEETAADAASCPIGATIQLLELTSSTSSIPPLSTVTVTTESVASGLASSISHHL